MVYLFDNPNPHLRQWSTRTLPPSGVVVVHTAENTPDYVALDGGAEAVARFIATRKDSGSYHTLCDSDSRIRMVDFQWAAWHDGTGTNHHSVGISAATRADTWPLAPAVWRDGCIEQMAQAAAEYARWLYGYNGTVIPARRITEKQAREKVPGFISHGELDPGRRSDPGAHYPWVTFLARYAELTRDLGTTPDGAFNPDDKEDFLNMAEISETRLREIIREENNKVIGQVWIGTADTNKKLDNIILRIGQARGWLVAIALKLHPTLAAAKRDANDYDLNNPKKKG